MSQSAEGLFGTVPLQALPTIWNAQGAAIPEEVARLLSFSARDVAKATGLKREDVRFKGTIPALLQKRMQEWAILIEMVASFFEGDAQRTALWFHTANPLLGGMEPRQMIQFGRSEKLKEFIRAALSGEEP